MGRGKITDIARVPGRRGARRILVDDDIWRTTSASVVERLDLRAGDERDLDELAAEITSAERDAARARALRLVALRERSTGELRGRLAQDGYPDALASEISMSFAASGYIDDGRYARELARTLLEVRGFGRARAERVMRARGIDDATVSEALADLCDAETEADRAAALAHTLASRCSYDPMRLARRLVSRGFAPAVALEAARAACDTPLSPGETPPSS